MENKKWKQSLTIAQGVLDTMAVRSNIREHQDYLVEELDAYDDTIVTAYEIVRQFLPTLSREAFLTRFEAWDGAASARRKQKRDQKRADALLACRDSIVANAESLDRTDALVMARVIAMAGLPKKPSKARQIERTLRLGADKWIRVIYTTTGKQLPFGEDRIVIAGIQHLALEQQSRVVTFRRANQLLKMFGIADDGRGLRRLRNRIQRVKSLVITILYATTPQGLDDENVGQTILPISHFSLPTRKELQSENAGQLVLEGLESPYGVVLSQDLWNLLIDAKNHLITPLKLLRLFVTRPRGWDFCQFLVARCGSARSQTVIDHESIISLFQEGSEDDRLTIRRLSKFLEEIRRATDDRLKAEFIELTPVRAGTGRPKKRWGLKVSPSRPLVWSGSRPFLDG